MASIQDIVDQFPAFATMLQIPEVADLMQKGADPANQWTSAYFQEQLWGTNWWKSTPETARTWQARKLVDPKTAAFQMHQSAVNVVTTAANLGMHLSPAEVALYSEAAASDGWDEKTLTLNLISNMGKRKLSAGAITATQDGLRSTAASYAIPVSEGTLRKFASQIQEGRQTPQGFESWALMHAKSAFPTLHKELDAGLTVKQIADPYVQVAAQTLGVNPETIDLRHPKWQRALQSRDAKGNLVGPMTTLDWQRTLMTDSAYGYDHTQNGQSAALQMRQSLEKTFGVTA